MSEMIVAPLAAPNTRSLYSEKVLWVHHWTEAYFSFAITRPPGFRFKSGEFVMIGLPAEPKPILRAYSIASPAYSDTLEFFSIKVADGLLTSRLQRVVPGDEILLGRKSTGTLVLDALKAGRRLWLVGPGTGLAPWLADARDPDAYDRFENVIIAHTVSRVRDLAYRTFREEEIHQDELLGDLVRAGLKYYPTVTREKFKHLGRFSDRLRNGECFRDLGLDLRDLDPAEDRVMLCGSIAMIKDLAAELQAKGFADGSNAEPGDFVIERAFVG